MRRWCKRLLGKMNFFVQSRYFYCYVFENQIINPVWHLHFFFDSSLFLDYEYDFVWV